MMSRFHLLVCLVFTVLLSLSSLGLANPVFRDHIEVQLVSEQRSIVPGQTTRLGLRFVPEEQWHTYWTNPGDSGLAIDLQWQMPEGSEVGSIVWPFPQRIAIGHLVNYGYEGTHLLPVSVTWPNDLVVGETINIAVDASWLVCKVECIPGQATLSLSLPVTTNAIGPSSDFVDLFSWADDRRPTVLPDGARFKLESDQLSVQLPIGATPNAVPPDWNPDAAHVFVVNENVVDHAKDFFIAKGDGFWQLALPVSPFFAGKLDDLGVVLVDPAQQKALQWNAVEGDLISAIAPTSDVPYGFVLLLALLGGVLLNLMPCVFPVLSIKALHLIGTPGEQHKRHALAYTAGVVLSFVVLASLLLALRAGGQAIGWGFQLQSPWVVGGLIYVLFVMGLSLSGLADFGTRLMGVGESMVPSSGHRGSFMTGVLATVVASPCTAPFMGTALGAAVLMPWAMGMGVFVLLGFGLALPLLVLGFVPALARYLPKPGPWMNTFKQLMAFPIYLAVVWLVWVFARQTDAAALGYILIGLVVLAFVLWLSSLPERNPKLSSARHALIGLSLVVALAMLASASRTPSKEQPNDGIGEAFSMERLQAAIDNPQQAVFVNMTADWCVTCLVNEQVALSGSQFVTALEENNVVYLKGDWTRRDEVITNYLAQFERNGVPLYVVYPKDGSAPKVLPQVLRPDVVLEVLESL